MSWLGCFGVLPSPNHILAKLAIFRGAEFSSHSPRATDSAAMFYYYFKPFATPSPRHRRRPLSPSEPLSFASFIPQFSLPPPLGTPYDPASFSRHLFQNGPPTTPLPPHHCVSCLRAEMKISRLLAIETELLFHEVVDPPPSTDLTLSFSFALGQMLYLRRESPRSFYSFSSMKKNSSISFYASD